MEWGVTAYISLGALGIALISLLDKYYGQNAKIIERLVVLENRKTEPEILQRIVALETKIVPFWRVLEEHMVDLLKQPDHLRMDDLLDEYKENIGYMSLSKMKELKHEMLSALEENKKLNDKRNEGRTFGYIVMLGILESRIVQKEMATTECSEEKKEFQKNV